MSKIYQPRNKIDGDIVINKCLECSHLRGIETCVHPQRMYLHCKVKYPCCVPKWCPLPNGKTGGLLRWYKNWVVWYLVVIFLGIGVAIYFSVKSIIVINQTEKIWAEVKKIQEDTLKVLQGK